VRIELSISTWRSW